MVTEQRITDRYTRTIEKVSAKMKAAAVLRAAADRTEREAQELLKGLSDDRDA
jgi:hypothetical protein